ncbi:MAG: O-antigen ligase family protein [Saprospiraceae bacterium]|nr:O-antigen ligase family protein [Saprospiraceae bacterium]
MIPGRYPAEWLIAIHFLLGAGVVFVPQMAFVWVAAVFVYAIFQTTRTLNRSGIAGYSAAYLSGLELLARMSGSGLPHEFTKYGISLLLLVGMLVEPLSRRFPLPILWYFIGLLLPGIWMAAHVFSLPEAIDQLSFNLSGPLCLTVATIYFFNRPVRVAEVARLFRFCLMPIVSALGFLTAKSPALQQIEFTYSANFEASGGYGPNQVASILGLGILMLVFSYLLRLQVVKSHYMVVLLIVLLTYRGLLTFSRGGMVAPILVSFMLLAMYAYYQRIQFTRIRNGLLSASVLGLIAWLIFRWLNTATGNLLYYRFFGERPDGRSVGLDKYTSGRMDIILTDLRVFLDNPLWGVGPGMGKYQRYEHGYHQFAAAHIEQSRMLSEHGILGLLALFILMLFPLHVYFKRRSAFEKMLMVMCLTSCFFFMTHSATRLSMPMLLYGLSFITLRELYYES